jgi:hypothetical protein
MFVKGASIKVAGHPHRDDPSACTVETMTLGKPRLERHQQLSDANRQPTKRPFRLLSASRSAGDWAQEQQVLARLTASARAVPISRRRINAGNRRCWPDRLAGFPPPA